ncbi:transglycosylase domain-containing protein [Streptosporangium sp. NBC_01756]|uniref:transglycosylase domain-containing protein n=1 Tax=Streptosporangium sp. NBC_01756 TaxID=2975950 RepID=UPI002DDB8C2D|nr:transglycosylase domain-containing protein [Streptosporangium sp. NBC_01756]WSC85890.1 penicillin-binding protein [Streptosporangium sp. NBC_01756]
MAQLPQPGPGRRRSGPGGSAGPGGTGGRSRSWRSGDRRQNNLGGGQGGRRGLGGPGGPGDGGGDGRQGRPDEDDGRPRRTGWKRFIPSWKIVVLGFTVLVVGLFSMIMVAYANTPLPLGTQQHAVEQGSIIYYRDGRTEIARLGTKREIVPISKIPPHVQDAFIAAENRTFRTDPGFSVSGIMRAVWSTATGQQVQGGSTITQEMARGYYDGLSQERTFQRKVKEIFVAIRAGKEMPKDQILANYLNTIYFGRGANGIQAAAQAFFDKDVDKLTPAEGAYLAGRIQSPDAFDRAEAEKDWAPTRERFAYAIDGMAVVDPAKYGQLPRTAKFPKLARLDKKETLKGINGYMVDIVQRELEKRGITKESLRSGGYRVTTTFDKKLMQAAKKAVETNLAAVHDKHIRANMAAVDPRNGRVIAFYSGHDYLKSFTNNAFDAYKQAASAFKPYVLAAWLENGYSLKSYVSGNGPVTLPGTKPIGNSHNLGAAVQIDRATAESVNTAFATMAQEVSLKEVERIAEGAGIDKKDLEQAIKDHAYGMSIGAGLVTPVGQAAGYGIFANGGVHYDAHVVVSVKTSKGLTVMEETGQPKTVISPDTAADATYAMQQVVKYGTAAGTSLPDGRPIAGKTGTNNENKEAWFVGYAPQLSAAVGMYKEVPQIDPKTRKVIRDANGYSLLKEVSLGNIEGAGTPTKIWRDFMTIAMAGKPIEPFPAPVFGGQAHDLVQKPAPKPTRDPFEDNDDDVSSDPACSADPACSSGDPDDGDGDLGTDDDPFENGGDETLNDNGDPSGTNGTTSDGARPFGGG